MNKRRKPSARTRHRTTDPRDHSAAIQRRAEGEGPSTGRRAISRPHKIGASRKPPPIVEVLWTDIYTRTGWKAHRSREDGSAECRTVGYLLQKDELYVRLSSSWSDDERADTTNIPMGVVRSITELRK